MGVSFWTVLGISLLVLAVPFVVVIAAYFPAEGGAFVVGVATGAGVAFLLVSAARRALERPPGVPEETPGPTDP